jgi:hypothetical protein
MIKGLSGKVIQRRLSVRVCSNGVSSPQVNYCIIVSGQQELL